MRKSSLILLLAAASAGPADADVKVPTVLGSHMVLQRDQPVPVWGTASPGEKVIVTFAGQTKDTAAAADGKWMVKLDPMPANATPAALTIQGNNKITLDDILVGEVWLGSGQSNMQWSVKASQNSAAEIAAANFPQIRLYQVPLVSSPEKQPDIKSSWQTCSPQTVPDFSGVLFFMGRKLNEELKVPVGLINSSWGGSRIEPWTPLEGYRMVPSQEQNAKLIASTIPGTGEYKSAMTQHLKGVEAWLAAAKETVSKNGALPPSPEVPGPLPHGNQQLIGLYNAMIHPLVPFAIRGAVWYQGESNNGEGMLYVDRKKALIGGWRKIWGQGEFPFYFVQLAPYNYTGNLPPAEAKKVTKLAEIWEAQAECVKQIPNTGMAVINDIGNISDIHPNNKQEAGRRLALLALAKNYGRNDLVCAGPVYKSHTADGAKIRISFTETGSGLTTRDGKAPDSFEIAGADGSYTEATAVIEGNDVIVSAAAVTAPVNVRFAFSQIATPNLMNKEGLPAGAFRTAR